MVHSYDYRADILLHIHNFHNTNIIRTVMPGHLSILLCHATKPKAYNQVLIKADLNKETRDQCLKVWYVKHSYQHA